MVSRERLITARSPVQTRPLQSCELWSECELPMSCYMAGRCLHPQDDVQNRRITIGAS